jgi:hypothetical protein
MLHPPALLELPILSDLVELEPYAGRAGWFTDREAGWLGVIYSLPDAPLVGVVYKFPEPLGPALVENDPEGVNRDTLPGVDGLESALPEDPAAANRLVPVLRFGLNEARRMVAGRGLGPSLTRGESLAGDAPLFAPPQAGGGVSGPGDGGSRTRPALTRACMAA